MPKVYRQPHALWGILARALDTGFSEGDFGLNTHFSVEHWVQHIQPFPSTSVPKTIG